MSEAAVVVLTGWHLPTMRSMPRALWRVRGLDRWTRERTGCAWVHRWASRRSLLLTTRWDSEEAAERWLASAPLGEVDRALRAAGARAWVERYMADGGPSGGR
jgi:hypothetical protein